MRGLGRVLVLIILLWLVSGEIRPVLAQCEPAYILPGGNCEHQGVAWCGDVNHDGVDDWLVGGHGTFAAVYSGSDGTVIHQYVGQAAYFGVSVSGGGNFDGDDYSDFAVGECNRTVNSAGGKVHVYSGAAGGEIRELRAPLGCYNFGCSIAVVGDMNEDGFDDLAVGAHCDQTIGSQAGRVIVYSGIDGSEIYDLYGQNPGDHFGYSVAALGDINRDGRPDLLVGATASASGRTYVYSGASGMPIYDLGYATGYYGYVVAGVGDVNGDSWDDFAIGCFLEPYRVTIVSGRTGFILRVLQSPEGTDLFGISVAGVGDVDKDGCDDVLVGAPNSSIDVWAGGRIYLYSGRTGRELFVMSGESESAHLGWSVARAGDIGANGLGDLLAGSGDFTGSGETIVVQLGVGECQLEDCCQGKVGDANQSGDDAPTIGDISVLIDFLFINETPLSCLEEADVNQSGGQWPTEEDITIGDISALIDHLFITAQELPDCL